MRDKPRCLSCGLLKQADPHVGYGPEKHDFMEPERARFGDNRRALNPRSEKTADYYRETRVPEVKEAVGDGRAVCEIKSPVCTKTATTLHEPATRGRFGGLKAAVEAGGTMKACTPCNGYVGEHPLWARERGFLVSNTISGRRSAEADRMDRGGR